MRSVVIRLCAVVAFVIAGLSSASAQQWVLNGGASHFYMQTAKAESIVEIHQFPGLEGTINDRGDANVKIDLTSVSSGIDVRDVRMRYLLFETYKFPVAEVNAHLDMSRLQDITRQTRVVYPLHFTLSLHGLSKEFETLVNVTRLSDHAVSVSTVKPIVVTTEDFALTAGLAKLSAAINGTPIVAAASFTFDLVFETGDRISTVEQEQQALRSTQAAGGEAGDQPRGVRNPLQRDLDDRRDLFQDRQRRTGQCERRAARQRRRHRQPLPVGEDRGQRPHRHRSETRSQHATVEARANRRWPISWPARRRPDG